METFVVEYLTKYGYLILFLSGLLGIVGIPAPEESLFVYIGILAKNGSISFAGAAAALIGGTLLGMILSYTLGRIIGQPLLDRYGKHLGVTKKRLRTTILRWDLSKSLLAGFFVPGVRQFNPYFAGIARFNLPGFLTLAVFGASLWVLVYMSAGFLISSYFHIEPAYVTAAGALFFLLFVFHLIIKWRKSSHSRR